jgi:putative ABC transport system permease protein
MTLKNIALLNLRRRKAKAAFVLAGLTIGIATVVALVSLAETLTSEINHKLEKYGANILITPKSEQLSLSYGGMSLGGFSFDAKEIRQENLAGLRSIRNAANIAAIDPMVLGAVKVNGKDVLLAGKEFKSVLTLKPWWNIDGAIPRANQVILGSEAARVLGLSKGQTVEVKGRQFTISGLLAPTGSQDDSLIFTPLATAQEILNKQGLVSLVEVAALCKDCPVDAMVVQISEMLPGAKVMAIQSVVKGRMETLKHFKNFSLGVSALVILVGSLVVMVTMMGSVKERTGEIGIFRAIGFRRGHVMKVVLLEAALVSAAAGALGYLVGLGAGDLSLPLLAESHGTHLMLDPFLAGAAVLLALLVGLGSSIYPALMAARLDPHEALRSL